IEIGAAIHWLAPKKKSPVERQWTSAPRYNAVQLRSSYKPGYNVGLRTGEPSKTQYGYIHVLDVDIRKPEMAAEAWAKVSEILPNYKSLPSVISGSRGESRHLYFLSESPLASKKLFRSEGFDMVFNPKLDREEKKRHWEIDIKATRTQLVLPPSIHPDTGLSYIWEREFDPDFAYLYVVPQETIDNWNVRTSREEIETDD